ncbi:low-density lipoprotein receptor-related protein 2-like [Lytechinus pictus]|uniref:low-density lipoprotein receptor-related protein 2-like n=1 Tax=Lytechinus pictus TaxID=7653 RepID=UPI0030B9BB0F
MTATLNGVAFRQEFNDPSSTEYMEFVSKAEAEIMNGLQNNQIGGYVMSASVTSLSPGSVVMGVAVGVSGEIGMTLSQEATNTTSAFDVQLAVANLVSTSINDAVTTTLSNNAQLGSSNAEVDISQVIVPVTAGGTDLPNEVTPGGTCDDGFFRCSDGLCIHESLRCDYQDHCITGEDELLCGECTSDQFECGNGKCIPEYFVCNYLPECQDFEDETGCGQGEKVNITLVQGTPMLVQNPSYPNPYPALENRYWAITTEDPDLIIGYTFIDIELRLGAVLNFENGTDVSHPVNDLASYNYRFQPEGVFALQTNAAFMFFYPGPYPGGRGFQIELNAIEPSTFTPAPCVDGQFQCASDGECIPSYWQCDYIVDCADETDEDVQVCANLPAPGECVEGNHQYQCDDGSCIHNSWKCDWYEDCPGGEDELYCDCDQSNSFQCVPTDRCIPDFWVCNWFFDCENGADETVCGGPDSTDARFLSPGESFNFTSPNYPNEYGANVYYLYTFETSQSYQIQIDVYQFSTALGGFTTIGDGLDPTNHNSALAYLNHYTQVPTSSTIRVTSTSYTLWLEIHGGPYGFDVLYASATSIPLTCEADEYICPGYCIPGDFECDFWHDCLNGEDEMGCGHEERINEYTLDLDSSQVFTSPNYSSPYVGDHGLYYWSFDGSAVEGDYIIRFTFHPYNISASSYVAFGSGLDFTNQSSFYAVYGGQDDLDLHHHYSAENQVWVEFYVGGESTSYPGFSATAELILRSDQCAENQFQCPDLTCIPLFYQCDFYPDCVPGYTDELLCPHPPVVHQEIILETSYDFTSPLYPASYPGNSTFFPYTFSSPDPSKHIMFEFSVFQVGLGGALSFGTGHDYFNFPSTFDVFHSNVAPTTVYAQSDQVWVEFFSGFTDGQGFRATVSTYPAGLIPPTVVCDSSQWACHDGLYCIPLSYRCDGHQDCPSNGEDEHGCPNSNCREYQFECKNGACLPEHSQCNGLEQCSEGEDEIGCGHQGECTDQQFRCTNGTCIPGHQRCNYFEDCLDGSDESQAECGPCNNLDSYTCNAGNCIPLYWRCDFYIDCYDGDDEMQCHFLNDPTNITLAVGEQTNITSQNWPDSADPAIYQLWHITAPEGALIHVDFLDYDLGVQSFIVFSDGHMVGDHSNEWAYYGYRFNPEILLSHNNTVSVQYFSGAYVGTRGFFISMRAVHGGHVHPACADTAYQCAVDSECIPRWWLCDGYPDCLEGEDEANCTYSPAGECGVHADEYKCNNTDICFPGAFRCDYMPDCPEHDDEFNCNCTGNEFKCLRNGQCLPNHFACDFYYNCGPEDRSDEIEGCGTPNSLITKNLQLEQLYTILSTNYPNPYPPRDYLVSIISAPDDYVVRVIFNDFSIDWKGFLAFGHGSDYHDHDQAFAVYNHHDKNPVNFYTPTNQFYIVFHGGPYGQSTGYNISMIPIEKTATPTVIPPGTCEPGQFACFDGTCYPGIYECDDIVDCDQGEDEARCYATGGTCQSHQFTCNDGSCIHGDWRCDEFFDCAGGEDEQDCPFRCFPGQFQCEVTETCIPQGFTCDYYPDCADGADEKICGTCGAGFFNCSDGACIPDYYVCDAYNDCLTALDEDSCGTIENTEYITLGVGEEQTIQSPGYPNASAHDAHCYLEWIVNVPDGYAIHLVVNDFSIPPAAWLQMGTGDDADNDTSRYAVYYASTNPREIVLPDSTAWISYHCGAIGLARGFSITIGPTDITTHNYTACEAGEFQCNDGHCIPSHYLCDDFKDCSQEEDENHLLGRVNCSSFNHYDCGTFASESQYECPSGLCIHSDWRCDGDFDCPSGADETMCGPCQETEFECPHQQCISGNFRCNFFLNCLGGFDDELNCGTPDTTTYIYLRQNSTNITSVNYPYDYKSNENYEIIVSVDPSRAIRVIFYDINLSIDTYLAFGHGNDPEDFDNLFESYSHQSTVPAEFNSITNEMFIKFHSGRYGGMAGYLIGLEDVDPTDTTFAPCAEGRFQCPGDGACIPLIWECDGVTDCGFAGDEINCQVPEGELCQEHHFTCNNSQCIRASWECDNVEDCSDGSDEENCPFLGCGASPFLFECSASQQCILGFRTCNHVADCDLGEDEASCGDCQDGFFTCSNGGCVPEYWRCDGDNDCFDGGDERNCGVIGTIENVVLTQGETQQVSSPGFPMRYESLCYVGWQVTVPVDRYVRFEFVGFDLALASYVTVGTGLNHSDHDTFVAEFHHSHEPRQYVVQSNEAWLEFHCGPFGGGDGFQIIISAVDPDTYIHPTCPSNEFQCSDGNCIETFDLCNGVKDCLGGEDEDQDCDNFDHSECGTNDDKFVCHTPLGPYCIYPQYRCDGIRDCFYSEDETDCECQENEFQCVETKRCINAKYYCDNFQDCSLPGIEDRSDEMGCANLNNTVSYNLTNPINITSPNYPGDYPKNDYTLTLVTAPEGMFVRARVLDLAVSHSTFIVFLNSHDAEPGNSNFIASLGFGDDETEILSDGNMMAIKFYSGFYAQARGYLIELSYMDEATCAPDEFTCEVGGCIDYSDVCDLFPHCPTFSDENNCQVPAGDQCHPLLFTCNDGRCITMEWRCDEIIDCSDAEDEANCTNP